MARNRTRSAGTMDRTDACALAAYAQSLCVLARTVEHHGDALGLRDSDVPKMREYIDAIVKIIPPTALGQ